MRKILFSLFCLLFLSLLAAPVSAWSLSFEGHWDDIPQSSYTLSSGLTLSPYNNGTAVKNPDGGWRSIYLSQNYTGYLVFTAQTVSSTGYIEVYMIDSSGSGCYYYEGSFSPSSPQVFEFVESGDSSSMSIYRNGELLTSASRGSSNPATKIQIRYAATGGLYLDDFSSFPYLIGQKGFVSSADNRVYFSTTTPVISGYSYYAQLNRDTGANVLQWNLSSPKDLQSFSPMVDLPGDGIYYMEIYGLDGELFYVLPFLFSSGGIFPDMYFVAESDTAVNIQDETGGGGLITGGGVVSLTPPIKENGFYNFSFSFTESAYQRQTEISKVYNTSLLSGSILEFSGLASQNYNVSIDTVLVGHTNNSDTWTYTVDWIGDNSYTISFSPDFSLPGVWGYVKNSDTQLGVKSVPVTIYNESFSTTIYTDINGMYYYTSGIAPNSAYTVSVSKNGYNPIPQQTVTTKEGITSRLDFYLDPITTTSGAGIYYAPHDVAFTVLEYWYSGTGLAGVPYSISENGIEIKAGSTDSKGMFTGSNMSGGTNYTITLTHNGTTYTEYVEPALSEYTFVLNKEGILHEYYNSWLNLSYSENQGNILISYVSTKTLSAAAVTVTAANGTNIISESKSDQSGSFNFNLSSGDYTIKFDIEAVDGSKASQFWTFSSPPVVTLFPASYPTWLKNILYVGIIMVFLLAFGKSKNDVACGSAAVLVSLGYYFQWLSCGFNFVVLIWIIALGAIYLHYKRTGALG